MAKWKKGQSGNPGGRVLQEKPFNEALRRAILAESGKRIRESAEKLLDFAAQGEAWAVKELADRTDGRTVQPVAATGDLKVTVTIKRYGRTAPE